MNKEKGISIKCLLYLRIYLRVKDPIFLTLLFIRNSVYTNDCIDKKEYKRVSIFSEFIKMIYKYPDEFDNWKKGLFSDPLIQMLLNNCHLTKIQLETCLINFLTYEILGKKLKTKEKAKIRKIGKKISRGAFNRSLKQAKRNIIKSIYTILLLGYLGLFDTPELEPFVDISKKLHQYINTYKKTYDKQEINKVNEIILLKKDLEDKLKKMVFEF